MIFDLDRRSTKGTIIKVLGVGGGGSNAVTHMFKQGIEGIEFGICNTDAQALELSPVPNQIHLGPNCTAGRGAGSKPEVGRLACEESIDEIKKFLEEDCQMLFVTAGMGGGTGTGAAPLVAQTAKEMGILTIGIVTLPFAFEGKKRIKNGIQGLIELKNHVDSLVVVSNDKLRVIHSNMKMSEAFMQADNILTTAAKGIAEIIIRPGYVNVDFEDVNTTLRDSGVAIMGIGEAEGENRASDAVDLALNSPLLEENNISGAKDILINITTGANEVTMEEIDTITTFVQSEAGDDANLIWGSCYDESLQEGISVTVIATGFEDHAIQAISGARPEKRQVVELRKDRPTSPNNLSSNVQNHSEDTSSDEELQDQELESGTTYQFKSVGSKMDRYNDSIKKRNEVIENLNDEKSTSTTPKRTFSSDFKVTSPPEDLDELEQIEKIPAYLRFKRNAQKKKHNISVPNSHPSRTRIGDDGEPRLGNDVPYLYDKPD